MVERTEIIGDAVLHLGDCREILPDLPTPAAVVTDVPYELSEGQLEEGGWVGRKSSGGLRDLSYGDWDNKGAAGVAFEALKLCVDVPTVVAFCEYRQLSSIYEILPRRSTRTLGWIKTNPTVMNGQHLFLPALEVAFYGKLPGAWFGGRCLKSTWEGAAPSGKARIHRTQKPIDLMKWVVGACVEPGEICVDPFMGSGTTGIAALELGRRFVGIELDQENFDAACRRIELAWRELDLSRRQLSMLDA